MNKPVTAGFVELPRAQIYTRMQTHPEARFFSLGAGKVAVYVNKSPGKTRHNEDSAGVYPVENDACVLAVADGMGGMPCGADASAKVVKTLATATGGPGSAGPVNRDTVLNAIETANKKIVAMRVGAGTTAAVVEISKNVLRSYHVGDSEILVVGQRGKIKLQTISHSPVAYAVEAGLLDQQEAISHNDRHLLSNYLGSADMRIEIGPAVPLARHDTVLLATDGLFDNIHLDELVELVRKGDLQRVTRNLITLLEQRMAGTEAGHPSKPDDVSFILYRRSA